MALPLPLATGSVPLDISSAYVYLAYDKNARLLYVGVTDHILGRFAGHRFTRSPWRSQAVRVDWEQYESREVAERVEYKLITTLHPRYNVTHAVNRVAADVMGHERLYVADEWGHLGRVARERREHLRRTQKSTASDARVDVLEFRGFERGDATVYRKGWLESVESALDWRPGSIESILQGGQADPMDDDDRTTRAFAAHDRLALVERL